MRTNSRRLLRHSTAIAALAGFAAPLPVLAQTATYEFDIAAQDLADALAKFGEVTRRQMVYDSAALRDKRSTELRGRHDAEEGLRHLLTGTGLAMRTGTAGILIVEAATVPGEFEAGQSPAATASAEGGDREIVVTGTIIRGAAPSGANLIVLGREDLDNTGRGTLAEALQTVPQLHGGGANAATSRSLIGGAPNSFGEPGALATRGAASLNLRGLGAEETLTLVNGRRLAPAGEYGAIADISALPMAAVERVEILADGASATYGADAMAGVVNIIMNRRFEGAETRLRAGLETRSGQPEFQVSQTFGWASDRGNILLSADYARQDGITAKGRPYAASYDLRPFGGRDSRINYCSPGNIFDSENRLIGAIPAGQDGTALTLNQIRIGEINKCDTFPDSSHLTPEIEKGSVYFAGSYDVTERLRLSADVIATKRNTTYAKEYRASDLTVPVSNAFRQMNGFHGNTAPLNQDISIRYLFTEVGPEEEKSDVWSISASAGLDYSLSDDWQISLAGSYGHYGSKNQWLVLDTRPASQGGALNQALASSNPLTAFNPFGDGRANSRDLVERFLIPRQFRVKSDYRTANLSFSGSLFDLPGGSVKIAVGGDYRIENFSTQIRSYYGDLAPDFQEQGALDAERNIGAAYAELFIPIFTDRNAVTGARRLSVSLSGRYDHYSDFGDTFNPKAGLTWMPLEGLTLKGSYGTSFKAPLFLSLYSTSSVAFSTRAVAGGPDTNNDGLTDIMYVAGGNPDLKPEQGKSWTAGVGIEPKPLPGLRLHATYFNLKFTDRFSRPPAIELVFANSAAFRDIVLFSMPSQFQIEKQLESVDTIIGNVPPAGTIEAIIDARFVNLASQTMDGVDAGASYRWPGLGGTFNASGEVSYLSRYSSRLVPGVPATTYIGNVGVPTRWKARGGLGWSGDRLSINGWVNHVPGYMNKLVQPYQPVSSYTTVDLSAQARLGGKSLPNGVSLAFYITNLFDQAPPFVDYYYGYDGANADPVGRRLSLQFIKRW